MSTEGFRPLSPDDGYISTKTLIAEIAYRGYQLKVTHTVRVDPRWNIDMRFYWASPTPADLSVPAHIAGEEVAEALNWHKPPDPTNKRQVYWIAKRLSKIPGNNLEMTVLRERAREVLDIAATILAKPTVV